MMVLPSAAKRSWKRQRKDSIDIIVVIAVTVIAVSAASILVFKLWTSSPKAQNHHAGHVKPDSFEAPEIMERTSDLNGVAEKRSGAKTVDAVVEEVADVTETGGEMHLSAKSMLSSQRPYLIYGTAWKKDDTADLVFQAVHAGFRFIDTACQPKHYNEEGVGYGWKTAAETLGLSREDFFLQTKFTSINGQDPNNLPYDGSAKLESQVRQSIHTSLRNLQTEYIDSLVLHSPMDTMDKTMRVWRVFEDFVDEGKIRQLGISNCYSPTTFKQLHQQSKIKPKVLQNRFHEKSNFDIELRNICKSLGVTYQSFWTLTANRNALASSDWESVAQKKGLTPQTLMYAFMMTLGHTPLSGTKNADHMHEDVDIMLRFQHGENVLNEDEMNQLSSLLGIQ